MGWPFETEERERERERERLTDQQKKRESCRRRTDEAWIFACVLLKESKEERERERKALVVTLMLPEVSGGGRGGGDAASLFLDEVNPFAPLGENTFEQLEEVNNTDMIDCFDWLLKDGNGRKVSAGQSSFEDFLSNVSTDLQGEFSAGGAGKGDETGGKKRKRKAEADNASSCDFVSPGTSDSSARSERTKVATERVRDDEKERKEKNRKSAAKSRQRKKEAWESMHKRCKELERINVALAHQLALASQELARVNRLASCDASGRGTGTKQPQPEVMNRYLTRKDSLKWSRSLSSSYNLRPAEKCPFPGYLKLPSYRYVKKCKLGNLELIINMKLKVRKLRNSMKKKQKK